MKKRSVVISGHSTSVSLEDEFWDALKLIADEENKSIAQIIRDVDATIRTDSSRNLSSELRLYALRALQTKILSR